MKINYIACSYIIVSSFTCIIGKKKDSRSEEKTRNPWLEKKGLLLGIGAGLCNFIGYMMVLKAFSTGQLSVIHPIFSLSILIPIVLSILFLKEKLTPRRGAAILFALLAVISMKVDIVKLFGFKL